MFLRRCLNASWHKTKVNCVWGIAVFYCSCRETNDSICKIWRPCLSLQRGSLFNWFLPHHSILSCKFIEYWFLLHGGIYKDPNYHLVLGACWGPHEGLLGQNGQRMSVALLEKCWKVGFPFCVEKSLMKGRNLLCLKYLFIFKNVFVNRLHCAFMCCALQRTYVAKHC